MDEGGSTLNEPPARTNLKPEALLSGIIIAVGIWLCFQAVVAVAVQRAPVSTAVRLAGSSPTALSRAGEAEYKAGRYDNALWLTTRALSVAPFDVRSMRVHGLAEAQAGNLSEADELITIAGNWSLRDDESHGWLVEQRLKAGDYGSAFAHADTLVRRRKEQNPLLFRLFTTAALSDTRAIAPLAQRLATRPFWRWDYLKSLEGSVEATQLQGTMALYLEEGPEPLNEEELRLVYNNLLKKGLITGLKSLRDRLGRPTSTASVANSAFEADPAYDPFDWYLASDAAVSAIISAEGESSTNQALRAERRSEAGGLITRQLLVLEPGAYEFSYDLRSESTEAEGFQWRLICYDNATNLMQSTEIRAAGRWRTVASQFSVPADRCSAQWLQLWSEPNATLSSRVIWVDNVKVSSAS